MSLADVLCSAGDTHRVSLGEGRQPGHPRHVPSPAPRPGGRSRAIPGGDMIIVANDNYTVIISTVTKTFAHMSH